MKAAWALVFLIGLLALGGCNNLRSTVAPELRGKVIPVSKIGVGGPGASMAVQAFIDAGYTTVEFGVLPDDVMAKARQNGLRYVAIVDATDTSQAVWDGFYSFSMRVSDPASGIVVWSGSASYGEGGLFINLQNSSKEAYRDLVKDLAKNLPPERGGNPPPK